MFGNWRKTYMIVERKAVTLETDRYSAGWCILFKAEARCGGAPTCPNAARLLRIDVVEHRPQRVGVELHRPRARPAADRPARVVESVG